MDRKIKNIMKMGILVLICMTIIGWCNISLCATSKENNIKSEAEKYAKDIDLNNNEDSIYSSNRHNGIRIYSMANKKKKKIKE